MMLHPRQRLACFFACCSGSSFRRQFGEKRRRLAGSTEDGSPRGPRSSPCCHALAEDTGEEDVHIFRRPLPGGDCINDRVCASGLEHGRNGLRSAASAGETDRIDPSSRSWEFWTSSPIFTPVSSVIPSEDGGDFGVTDAGQAGLRESGSAPPGGRLLRTA